MKTKPTKQIVAENIQRLMDSADPARNTQFGLAKQAGVAQSSIGRLIRGEVEARLDLLEAVAGALQTTVGDLTTERNSSYIKYDRNRFSALPDSEREKAESYISFLIESNEKIKRSDAMEFSQLSSPTDAERRVAATVGDTRLNQQPMDSNETKEQNRSRRLKKSS
jgi:transcriptional regulator with XRE-family HTH domain